MFIVTSDWIVPSLIEPRSLGQAFVTCRHGPGPSASVRQLAQPLGFEV